MSILYDLLELNEEQSRILSGRNRIAIEAGAGSGKTRSLVAKYLHILESGEATVDEIVAITFTKNAARELRRKIRENISNYIDRHGEMNYINRDSLRRLSTAPISTIHGFCSRLLRENPYDTLISPGYTVIDDNYRDDFYDQNARDFVLREVREKNTNLLELMEYEGYNYTEVAGILNTILHRSSLLHIEPPFPAHNIEDSGKNSDIGDFGIPEYLVTDLVESLTGRSSKTGDSILEAYKKLDSRKNVTDKLEVLVFIYGKIDRKEPYKDEIAEDARQKLLKYLEDILDSFNQHLTRLYLTLGDELKEYIQAKKKENHILDFEDQIRHSYDLLRNNSELLEQYRERFRYIIVDEFQDTDSLQFNLLTLLTENSENSLIVVGDKKQSIYSFRGGDPEIMEHVLSSKQYTNYSLKSNYRSTEALISYFNSFFLSVFSDNYESMIYKGGKSVKGTDIELIMTQGVDHNDARSKEIVSVCNKLTELLDSGEYFDIALLFRNSTHASEYEKELKKRNISFSTDFGSGFYRSHEVRDIVSMLKYIVNPGDELSKITILRSGFYGASDDAIHKYVTGRSDKDDQDILEIEKYLDYLNRRRSSVIRSNPLSVISFILHDLAYSSSLAGLEDGIDKYLNTLKFYNICEDLVEKGYGITDIIEYFDEAREFGNETQPHIDDDASANIRLTTVHRSKGLEYDAVILCDTNYPQNSNKSRIAGDAEQGFFIRYRNLSSRSWKRLTELQKEKEIEDEKRLLYVAKTRARKKLVLTLSSKTRNKNRNEYHDNSFADFIKRELNISDNEKPDGIKYEGIDIPIYQVAEDSGVEELDKRHDRTGFCFEKTYLEDLYREEIGEHAEIPRKSDFSGNAGSAISPVDAGDMMHRFLELWDFENGTVDKTAEYVLDEFYMTDREFVNTLANLAERFSDSGLYQLVRDAVKIKKEYGFVINFNDRIERGRIDLLLEYGDSLYLVDYKYRQTRDVSGFLHQMELYSEAVEMKYGYQPSKRYIALLPSFELINI